MKYDDPGCAYCPTTVRACRQGESRERGPGFCPTEVDADGIEAAWAEYETPEVRRVARVAAEVEGEGYCKWSRVEEICAFAHKMGFTKIGIACCISFVDHANTLSQILESHGFEVASVACKHGGIDSEAYPVDTGLLQARDGRLRGNGLQQLLAEVAVFHHIAERRQIHVVGTH